MDDTYTGGQRAAETAEDYRQYDKIWQRVSPDLNPYPEARMENTGGVAVGGVTAPGDLEQLPGAQADPCCMGSAAMDSVGVVESFIEDETAMRQFFLTLAGRTGNQRAVRLLRQIAARKTQHIRRLSAAYYLITGQRYTHTVQVPAPMVDGYCAALRSAYHEEACGGLNYLRAADGALDPCLQKLFREMGETSYHHAEQLLDLLSCSMRNN